MRGAAVSHFGTCPWHSSSLPANSALNWNSNPSRSVLRELIRMPRKLLVSVIVLLGLSVGIILTMGMSPLGSLLTNFLQIVCCGLAAGMCFAASKRGRGLSRPFWALVGSSIAMWGVANLGWMYYENWLHASVPRFSLVRILFDVQGIFYAIALFLDKEKDSAEFN